MLNRRTLTTAFIALGLSVGLASQAQTSDQALNDAIAGSWRSQAQTERDIYRHPAQSLTFWGLKPHMIVVEIDPGNGGWWLQILAPYAHKTDGHYIAGVRDPKDENFWKAVADTSIYGKIDAYALSDLPAGCADLVLVARAFHNWARQGDTTDNNMKIFYDTLKPGGILAVEQHRAPDGSDPKAGTGYVPESYVIDAAIKAGFVLEARSEINANPKDDHDHPFGVWTLKPTRSSSENGQPQAADFDRAHYDAIGESDRMTLKFRKPS
ncbi:MAG: methyltransferase [Asticcacaulis sp.]